MTEIKPTTEIKVRPRGSDGRYRRPNDTSVLGLTQATLAEMVFEMMGAVDQKAAHALVDAFFEIMIEGLIRDGELIIKDIGVFKIRHRRAQLAGNINPHLPGIKLAVVSARKVVTFRPAPLLISQVNHRPHVSRAQRYPNQKSSARSRVSHLRRPPLLSPFPNVFYPAKPRGRPRKKPLDAPSG